MGTITNNLGKVKHFLNYNFEKLISKSLAKPLLGNEISGYEYTCPKDIEREIAQEQDSDNQTNAFTRFQNKLPPYFQDNERYSEKSVVQELCNLPETEYLEARIAKLLSEIIEDGPGNQSFARDFLVERLINRYCNRLPKEKRLPGLDILAKELKVGEYAPLMFLSRNEG